MGLQGVENGDGLHFRVLGGDGGQDVLVDGLLLVGGVQAVLLDVALRQHDVDAGGDDHVVHRGLPRELLSGVCHRGDVVVGQVRHEVVVLVGGVLHDEQPANGLRGGLGLLLGSGVGSALGVGAGVAAALGSAEASPAGSVTAPLTAEELGASGGLGLAGRAAAADQHDDHHRHGDDQHQQQNGKTGAARSSFWSCSAPAAGNWRSGGQARRCARLAAHGGGGGRLPGWRRSACSQRSWRTGGGCNLVA